MSNPFDIAVNAGLQKHYSAKEYLMKIKGMSEDEAEAYLLTLKPQETNP